MTWRIELTGQARRDLGRLDRAVAARVLTAIERLAQTELGNVRRLTGDRTEWRLRVGDWRVLFEYERPAGVIRVLRVLPRGRAYRD